MVALLNETDGLDEGAHQDPRAQAAPRVLVRTFSVPSGMPWEQAKAAQLEARHAAPLPISDLDHQLRRAGGWSPGRPGRYVVFYVRRAEMRGPFETTVDVEGAPTRVAFGAREGQWRRAGSFGLVAALVAASVLALVVGLGMAVNARNDVTERLGLAERGVALKLRAARTAKAQDQQARDLAKVVGGGKPLTTVLGDLAWTSDALASGAQVTAVHWDQGVMALEVRGKESPFERSPVGVRRSPNAPVPGHSLWGFRPGAKLESAKEGTGRDPVEGP